VITAMILHITWESWRTVRSGTVYEHQHWLSTSCSSSAAVSLPTTASIPPRSLSWCGHTW